ncbi:MAG: aldo/keto reductase [Firmicutes bacterium]|nr:aldo/keto reductase [Bacillota bacterium]
MIYKPFQDLQLSALGLGMMRLPLQGKEEADIDEALTAEMIGYAYEKGVNYYDTAWGYHDGNSEWVAGRLLSRYPRESYYLASKFPGYDLANMDKVEEIFTKQLEKCQTPYFDFYLFHNVYEGNIREYLNPQNGILDYLLRQKAQGKIRHLGFSTHGSLETIREFLEAYGAHMEFCQLQLNYLDWHFQDAQQKVALLKEAGLPVWVMEPLRGGKLAQASQEMTAHMRQMRPEETVPGWAFRFLQAIPEVTLVLSGMSNMEQLQENIRIFQENKPLRPEEFAALVRLADNEVEKAGVPCTACHYCLSHCPQGLPIADFIAWYNEHKITGGGFLAPMSVSALPEEKRPDKCIACHSCEQVCPQQIQIANVLSDFSQMIGM